MDLLDRLFSSRVRAKILEAFFYAPGVVMHAYQLAQSIGENYSAVWKELVNLESLGILTSHHRGNVKEYQVNDTCPIINELRSLVLKTKGLGNYLREQISALQSVDAAFIFGSFAAGNADEKSDVDLFIIGDIDVMQLSDWVHQSELKIKRPVNFILMNRAEWQAKKELQEPFIQNVLNSPKIFLIGDVNAV